MIVKKGDFVFDEDGSFVTVAANDDWGTANGNKPSSFVRTENNEDIIKLVQENPRIYNDGWFHSIYPEYMMFIPLNIKKLVEYMDDMGGEYDF
jgi:hypothetical protein